jgi:hypothetical protein
LPIEGRASAGRVLRRPAPETALFRASRMFAMSGKKARKYFFFEKKKQKTFT